MDALICEAIRRKALLQFLYRGRLRVVAPYCHGLSTRGGKVLRAVQVRGYSSSNGFGFGKLWFVDEIENPKMLTETFIPDDSTYNPDDSAMKEIHCRLSL
jgi:hypothetical protein